MVSRNIKTLLAVALIALALPVVTLSKAQAATVIPLQCQSNVEIDGDAIQSCDLEIKKMVSINGGAFVEAPTSGAAVQAHIGDTITWKITVNKTNQYTTPFGLVTVKDVLPTNVQIGTTTPSAGTFADNTWSFALYDNLPATLVVTSTANTLGMVENTALFDQYDPCGDEIQAEVCIDPPYVDSNNANNSSSAFVNVVAVPVVTPAPVTPKVAAPNTGFGISGQSPVRVFATYAAASVAVLAVAIVLRRRTAQSK